MVLVGSFELFNYLAAKSSLCSGEQQISIELMKMQWINFLLLCFCLVFVMPFVVIVTQFISLMFNSHFLLFFSLFCLLFISFIFIFYLTFMFSKMHHSKSFLCNRISFIFVLLLFTFHKSVKVEALIINGGVR